MQTLSVLSVEDGAIVVASPAGERFRLPVDAALRTRLLEAAAPAAERRLSPREIQAHVRAGRSAEQVAAMTGVPVSAIERFVGPVLAERAYVVESALAVRLPPETEGARSRTFGAVLGERLDALAAADVRWSSAKEPAGWVLAARFTADDVEHHARWRFDPKHMALEPDNVEASTLSQQGTPAALTPRLRAIEPTAPVAVVPPVPVQAVTREAPAEPARFDSGVFGAADLPRPAAARQHRSGRRAPADDGLPETRAIDVVPPSDEAAVFAPRPERLDAPVTPLRGRRSTDQASAAAVPAAEAPHGRRERRADAPEQPAAPEPEAAPQRPRRGRTSMPSWDEIVFGRDDPS